MSKNKSKETSPQKLAANRRNAQKSTGPQTPRARRTHAGERQSRYVKSLSYDQAKLGQNPEDFQEYLADLIAEWLPVGAMEMTLVEDLATLEMERRLVDRAQRGRLVARLEREEAAVARTSRRLDDDATSAATRDEVVALGLRNSPDSSGKYREIIKMIEGLLELVRCGDFSCPAEEFFAAIYGEHPTWRALQIITSYRNFVERYADSPESFPESGDESPLEDNIEAAEASGPALDYGLIDPEGPRPWGEPARAQGSAPSAAENEYNSMYILLLEEYDAVNGDYGDFVRDRADLSRARRDALLAPSGTRSALMIRQKNSIDRHIERKTKLLLLLQKERRARKDAPHSGSHRNSRQGAANVAECPANPQTQSRKRKSAHHGAPTRQLTRRLAPAPPPANRRFALGRSATSILFFLLGVILARLPLSMPASIASPIFPASFNVAPEPNGRRGAPCEGPLPRGAGQKNAGSSSRTASRQGDPGPTEMSALCHPGALKSSIVRDVFLPIESHQQYENKEKALRAKAKLWLFAAHSPMTSHERGNNSKASNQMAGVTHFILNPLTFNFALFAL